MECDENGRKRRVPARADRRGLKRKRGAGGEGVLQLAFAAAVPGPSLECPMRVNLVSPCPPNLPITTNIQPTVYPFMNSMDAISYWIYTKRAPCLFNYDNVVKKQIEQAHCSNPQPISLKSKHEDEPTPKRKRKLKLLDEDSVSSEKQQNIYFKSSQHEKTAPSSCKSDGLGSDIDFNIKNSSVQKKSKKMKMPRNNQATVHKKKATSTPKVINLRRSLRKAQHDFNKSKKKLNDSFEIMIAGVINGSQDITQIEDPNKPEKVAINEKTKSKVIMPKMTKTDVVLNGQFEDLSDVSGLTANYIRSTKLHASKSARKLRNRTSRTLIKHTKQRIQHAKTVMCVNKSVVTGLPDTNVLNRSTESSQNALNLVTVTKPERSDRVNKSTSLLKFMETSESNHNDKIHKQESKNNLNISFQSRSSGASRYPRRHKNNTTETTPDCSSPNINNSKVNSSSRKYNMRRAKDNSNRKENSEEKIISKTRSGRKIGLKINVEESGCSMLNNSTDQVSSSLAVNVACPNEKRSKKNNSSSRCLRSQTYRDKSGQLCKDTASDGSNQKHPDGMRCALEQSTSKCVRPVKKSVDKIRQSSNRDSLRDKSGFAACFSDSDSDSEPLKQQKFFC